MEKIKQLGKTGFFHIFGGSTINKIVGFLSSFVLVRILTKTEYGVFTYAWNIYSIVLLFNGLGMEAGVLQMCSESGGNTAYMRGICSYGTRSGMLVNVLLALVLLGVGLLAPLKVNGAGDLLVLLCLLPMAQLAYNLTTACLRAQKRNQEFSRLSITNTAMVFLFTAAGALLMREKGMALGYYGAYIISALLGFFHLHVRLVDPRAQLEKRDQRALRSIAFVSMCNNGLSQLMYLLDVFVLGIVDPQETLLASYKVATIIPSALTFIPLALVTYLYPYFAQNRHDGVWCLKRYKTTLLGLGGLNMLISASLFALAPLVIRLMFGAQYLDAVPVFRLLAVNYFVSGTFRILSGNLLVTQRKLSFNLLVALISGGVNVAADFLFIGWWGPMGAALATVLVTLISSMMSTTYLIHTFKKAAKTGSVRES